VSFIRAISDASPTSKLKLTLLQTCSIELKSRPQQPRKTDSGVQLAQRPNLRDVGGKRPGETVLAKQPAGPPSVPSGGGRNRPSMGTYRLAIDGIEETKAGNRPVSEFRATFLQNHHCGHRAEAPRRRLRA
jgi:hypothetical protein